MQFSITSKHGLFTYTYYKQLHVFYLRICQLHVHSSFQSLISNVHRHSATKCERSGIRVTSSWTLRPNGQLHNSTVVGTKGCWWKSRTRRQWISWARRWRGQAIPRSGLVRTTKPMRECGSGQMVSEGSKFELFPEN